MCGIAGIVARAGGSVRTESLHTLGSMAAHRGPDDSGSLAWTPGGFADVAAAGGRARVGLVHRRLAILDLRACGRQPMRSVCGRYAIVYNGEVYNYRELRIELEQLGHQFVTETDTEVVLAAWAAWGVASLRRFIGMFAFAMLDTVREQLVLARDPFGMKPLFYVEAEGELIFASEIKALLAMPGVRRVADPQCVYEFLRFAVSDRGDRTFFADIRQVRPAHTVTVGLADLRPVAARYWQLHRQPLDLSFDEAAAELRGRFLASVSLHLRADVPIGAALSGGIDSSAIVAAMRRLEGPALELHTFTYAAAGTATNEESWAALAARHAGAISHVARILPGDVEADLNRLVTVQDEPVASSSVLAQYRVFAAVRQAGIKVTLDGQGADEYLAGYPSFVLGRLAGLIRRGRLRDAWMLAAASASGHGPAAALARSVALLLPDVIRGSTRRLAGQPDFPRWLSRGWFDAHHVGVPAFGSVGSSVPLIEQLEEALADISLPMLLRYADRNAMAHSVESRMPFLDTSMVEFCLSLPEAYLLAADGTTKAVFRAAMRGIVPDAILDRRDKVGFVTPEHAWLLARAATVDAQFRGTDVPPVIDTAALSGLWSQAREGSPAAVAATWRMAA
jgi:asparagine synthase (glutamine-hydrolysing)